MQMSTSHKPYSTQPNSQPQNNLNRSSSSDPFLGNFLKNLIRESIQTELASWQKLAPTPQQMKPPFLPGMSHFTQPLNHWDMMPSPMTNLQQMSGPLNQGSTGQWNQ